MDCLTSSPPWKGEGSLPEGSSFPPSVRGYIPHLVGSRVAQRTTPIKHWGCGSIPPQGGLSLPSSSPLKEGDTGCPSLSPIKPSIELGRSVISVTKRCLKKEIFKLSIRGLSIPLVRLSAPLTPNFVIPNYISL